MLFFVNDYGHGAHPRVLEALSNTNLIPQPGYGSDSFTENAKAKIRAACQCPDAEICFLVGGTQTNLTVIAAALRPYQAVISAVSGHINVHETGAIEATGHKVIGLPSDDGNFSCTIFSYTSLPSAFSLRLRSLQ